MFKKAQEPKYLTEAAIRELIDEILRPAMREQARGMEKHLGDIHKRLLELEKK
jgi:hypothetical protein